MDSLLIFCPPSIVDEVIKTIKSVGIAIDIIGEVVESPKHGILIENGKEIDMTQRYRESAYTRVKQVVGDKAPLDKEKLMAKTKIAAAAALEKSEHLVQYILKEQRANEQT